MLVPIQGHGGLYEPIPAQLKIDVKADSFGSSLWFYTVFGSIWCLLNSFKCLSFAFVSASVALDYCRLLCKTILKLY